MAKENNQITDEQIEDVFQDLEEFCKWKSDKKGRKPFVSRHEILGLAWEEFMECGQEVRRNDDKLLYKELRDLALICVWSMASLKSSGKA